MLLEAMEVEPITASQQTLGKIFSDEYAFSVPPYQRPYSWEETQSKELVQDVWDACEEAYETNRQATYFLGSVVLIKRPQDPTSEVVDGQQRLTTITILISVLRDMSSPKLAAKRNAYLCEEGDPDRGTKDRYRLITRPQDQKFFENAIQKPDATKSLQIDPNIEETKEHFIKNAIAIKDMLSTMTEAERDRFVAFLIQRCFLVVIAVSSVDTAHRVFRVLNTRGLDLAPTDILKAQLLEELPVDDQEQAARTWESFETILGRDKFVDLFNIIRMIYQREKPRERLEIGFPRFVQEFQGDPDNFLNNTLAGYARCFADILDNSRAKKSFGPRVAKYLTFLRRLDNSDWVPVALMFLSQNPPEAENLEFITALERCAYFLFVCRYNINDRINRFAKSLGQLHAGKKVTDDDSALRITKKEQAEWKEALDGPVYEMTRVRLPLLLRLDAAVADGAAEYDHEVVTVEHIVPQNPKKESDWNSIFRDEDDRYDWIHSLGNLVLLPHAKNVRAGNMEFDKKKKEYFLSKDGSNTFALTSMVVSEPSFDRSTLERRHEILIKKLCKTWEIEY